MSELKHVKDRVIVSIDIDSKNWHTFESGLKIRRLRQYNNLDRKYTEPVNATVISAENIPGGVDILLHPNEIHDSNKIFNYIPLSGNETSSSVKYYSIHVEQCFIFFDENKWKPLKGFATALRVFKPYSGMIAGIKPLQIKDVLYITSGEYKGKIMNTLRSCDYEIIFQAEDGREKRIIRCRTYENENHDREELICVRNDLTEQLEEGELLIGIEISDCKTLKEMYV
ncbi:MAG TPA: hypothetical protein VIM07_00770 [Chitinophagaceae bacterium]